MERLKAAARRRQPTQPQQSRTQAQAQAQRRRVAAAAQGPGLHRDLFVAFDERRRKANVHRRTEMERVESLLSAMRMTVQSPSYDGVEDALPKPAGKVSSSFTNLWGKISSTVASEKDICRTCNDEGASSLMRSCRLCSNSICPKCAKHSLSMKTTLGPQSTPFLYAMQDHALWPRLNERLPLGLWRSMQCPIPDQNAEFLVCRRCDMHLRKWRTSRKLQQAQKSAQEHTLVSLYNILAEVRHCICKGFPAYQDLVSKNLPTLPEGFDLSSAIKYDKALARFFENYQLGLKQLRGFEASSKKEATLQANIVRGFVQGPALKRYQPLYRVLHKTLIERLPKPKPKRQPQEAPAPAPTAPVVVAPVVTKLEPAECKLEGGDLVLTGTGFHPECQVWLDSIPLKVTHISNEVLYVVLPPLPGGSKDLELRNPDGGRDELDRAVLYSELAVATDEAMAMLEDEAAAQSAGSDVDEEEEPEGDAGGDAEQAPPPVNTFFLQAPRRHGWGFDPYEDAKETEQEQDEAKGRHRDSSEAPDSLEDALAATQLPTTPEHQPAPRKPSLFEDYQSPQRLTSTALQRATYGNCTPVITTITPALAPLEGTLITITGQQFAEEVSITFGGHITVDVRTKYRTENGVEECEVRLVSPRMPEGFHEVAVRNPGGGVCAMPGIFYTEQVPSPQFSRSSTREVEEEPLVPMRRVATSRRWG